MKRRKLRKEVLSYITRTIDMLDLEEHFEDLTDEELAYMENQKDQVVAHLINTYKF